MSRVYERKNINYGIKVIYLDGKAKVINLDEKNIDSRSYKEVIEFYNVIKNNCKKAKEIEVIGYDKNRKSHMLFTKELIPEDKNKYRKMDSYDLVKDIIDIIDVLQMKNSKSLTKIKSTVDKKQDIILHKIETFDLLEVDEGEDILEVKAQLFDQLKEIRSLRRRYKVDINVMTELEENMELKNISDKLKGVLYRQKKEDVKFLTDELIEELKMMKEVSYKNNKQRVKYMRQLKGRYEKIVNDEVNQKLICYNHAR